jgi:hypothetical protein
MKDKKDFNCTNGSKGKTQELIQFYSSPDIVLAMQVKRVMDGVCVTFMGEYTCIYSFGW